MEGGRGEKLKKIFLAPNELKSPKNKMSFYYIFLLRGDGWVKSLIENSINFSYCFEPFSNDLLKSFLSDSTIKMIPTRAANASSVNRVKYLDKDNN